MEQEDDVFWQIALTLETFGGDQSDDDDDGDDEECDVSLSGSSLLPQDSIIAANAKTYCLPVSGRHRKVCFRLAGLQASDNISSPLGAQAWYGSALLSALLLQPPPYLESVLKQTQTALELGSGAVGLSAFTLAWLMANNNLLKDKVYQKILMTDIDPVVLHQLRLNVESVNQYLRRDHPNLLFPELQAHSLDWGDYPSFTKAHHLDNLQLILGSELVYSCATANACANFVLQVLLDYPEATVMIVQITDREGWNDFFLPNLINSTSPSLRVQHEALDSRTHLLASKLIPMGGTLDCFDFGVCYITRSDFTALPLQQFVAATSDPIQNQQSR